MSVLRVAINCPLRSQFDYLPPANLTPEALQQLRPGCRVKVPFGAREVTGYLMQVSEASTVDPGSLKAAIEVLDYQPLVSNTMVALSSWAAHYYHHPIGEVICALYPTALRQGEAHKKLGTAAWMLSTRGKGLPEGALRRSPKQAQALSLLQNNSLVSRQQFQDENISTAVLRALESKDLIQRCEAEPMVNAPSVKPGLDLNTEQRDAVTAIARGFGQFSSHLLEGVTGSGKTEVYLQLISQCLDRGKQALLLVPEIGLTPQTLSRFEARFEANIVSLHSGMAPGARYEAWEMARSNQAHIVIGTRSSVFVPLNNVGIIIVDEEHDGSYAQRDGFRYSARDIAVKRAQLEQCPVVLGSATPSIETIYNAEQGRYHHHALRERAGGAQLPPIDALDIRGKHLQSGFSQSLLAAIGSTIDSGGQVLLFLNRRGYAPTLLCHDCGWMAQCKQCDARLTVHRKQKKLRCHHCSASQWLPRTCPECHGSALITAGVGTEQAQECLTREFPHTEVHRVDSDSMRAKNAMQLLGQKLDSGEPCILLGTQMLTKGHHFPGVTLVAVIDADAALFSADFRGEERMAQLLTQVAGRAGRAEKPGRVLLQTHYPDHPVLQAIVTQPYPSHARNILSSRLTAGLPPASTMAIVRTDATDGEVGERFLFQLRQQAQGKLPTGVTLIGPLPSPMQRRAGRFRHQLLLTGVNRELTHRCASNLVAIAETLPAKALKWSIDIDPYDAM